MRFLSIFAAATILLNSCQTASDTGADQVSEKLRVVCTTSIMTDWVSRIATDQMEVVPLLQKGVDPHVYKPGKKDLDLLRSADVVIYHGVHLEGKIIEVLEKMNGVVIIDAAKGVPDSLIISDPNFPASKDPHYWFDLNVVNHALNTIAQELAIVQPKEAQAIAQNLRDYSNELQIVSDSVQQMILQIPEEQRTVITTHDALSYFARSYGLQVKTLQGASTVSSFGLKEITDLVNFICDKGVPAIFLENIVSPQAMESVQRGCEEKGCPVVLGPELLSDSLGHEEDQDSFAEMLYFNASLLVGYLGK